MACHSILRSTVATFLILSMASQVSSAGINAIPADKNLGELQRGQEIESSLLINTTLGDYEEELNEIKITPAVLMPDNEYIGDSFDTERISDEDVSSWIDMKEEIMINGQTSERYNRESGGEVEAEGKIDFSIEVPEEAEPGIHYFWVEPNAKAQNRNIGRYSYALVSFEIPGNVERSIRLEEVEARRNAEDEVKLYFNLNNAGTVTTIVKESDIRIFDNESDKIAELTIPDNKVSPSQTQEVEVTWSSFEKIENGNYRVKGDINHLNSIKEFEKDIEVKNTVSQRSNSESSNSPASNNSNVYLTGKFLSGSTNSLTIILFFSIIAIIGYLFKTQT